MKIFPLTLDDKNGLEAVIGESSRGGADTILLKANAIQFLRDIKPLEIGDVPTEEKKDKVDKPQKNKSKKN